MIINNIIFIISQVLLVSKMSQHELRNLSIFNKILVDSIFDIRYLSESVSISFKMWLIFIIGHLGIAIFIMYKDLRGSWDKYRLIPKESDSEDILKKYLICIPYIIRDLFFLLPIFLVIYVGSSLDFISKNLDIKGLLIEFLFKMPISYWIGNMWDMTVHRIWHEVPFLYKYVHKEHHINISEMCSLSAWRDSWLEFILEIPGTFLIGPFIMRMNWLSHALLISTMGFISAIDHSGFYLNYLIDSRYHYEHHKNPNSNFADIELLDYIFGTKSSKQIHDY